MTEITATTTESPRQERRMRGVLACFVLAASLILLKLIATATLYPTQRRELRQLAQAKEVLLIPGLRGTLVDHEHHLIAQSHRRLVLTQADRTQATNSQPIAAVQPAQEQKHTANHSPLDLTKDSKVDWNSLQADKGPVPRIYCVRTVKRIPGPKAQETPSERILNILGNTKLDASLGLETGVSGRELEWDQTLKPGLMTCKILGDRRRVILSAGHPNGKTVHLLDHSTH